MATYFTGDFYPEGVTGDYYRLGGCYGYGDVYGYGNGYGSYHDGWRQPCVPYIFGGQYRPCPPGTFGTIGQFMPGAYAKPTAYTPVSGQRYMAQRRGVNPNQAPLAREVAQTTGCASGRCGIARPYTGPNYYRR